MKNLPSFDPHSDIFYTVLSDDSLISKVTVDTDEFLHLDENNGLKHAQLIIEINTRQRNEPYMNI